MNEPDLLVICAAAFVAVFLLLSLLAVVMRVLVAVFPEKPVGIDGATLVALSAAVSAVYPGSRITNVEETK
jgi:ABC-type transporter Mla subunit MlaD